MFWLGNYIGFKDGVNRSYDAVEEQLKKTKYMQDELMKLQDEACEMKIHFLEKIHQTFEVRIMIKDKNNVSVEYQEKT